MASNRIPENPAAVCALTVHAIGGLQTHGAEAGLAHMEPRLARCLQTLEETTIACANEKAAYERKRIAYGEAQKALRAFLLLAIACFKLTWGRRWSPVWRALPLEQGSLEIPRNAADLALLVHAVAALLERTPGMESPVHGITAAAARALYEVFQKTSGELNAARMAQAEALEARDAALKEARFSLTLLRTHLNEFGPESSLWLAFGFNLPANPSTPAAPLEVRVTEAGAESVEVQWDRVPCAERYRVYANTAESKEPPMLVARTPLLRAKVRRPFPGQEIVVTVTAVNRAGESVGSEPVRIPVVLSLAPETAPSLHGVEADHISLGIVDEGDESVGSDGEL